MPNPIPSEYLPLYADRLKMFGELTVSGSVATELLRAYQKYLTYRMTLAQIAQGAGSNVDFAAWAKRVTEDDKPVLATIQTRKNRTARTPEPV